ncbi:MAG: hypothetical protein IJQ99_10975, partial [Synergistaceae bacterium]|nr:hypothetical protein [Synergistaceae bacterium]
VIKMSNATLTKSKYENEIKTENDYYEDDKPAPIFDRYGNPTPETLQAFYEIENGLTEEMTLEEFNAQLDEIFGTVETV